MFRTRLKFPIPICRAAFFSVEKNLQNSSKILSSSSIFTIQHLHNSLLSSNRYSQFSSSSSSSSWSSNNSHYRHYYHNSSNKSYNNLWKFGKLVTFTASVGFVARKLFWDNEDSLIDYLLPKCAEMLKIVDNDNEIDDEDKDKKNRNKSKSGKYSGMNFIADIVEQFSKSVVFIESTATHPGFLNSTVTISSGSGFLVDKKQGIILTNAHVISNAQQVAVKFNDGRVIRGVVEFVDDRLDLATVRVSSNLVADIEEIVLTDSKKSRAGEWVIAVGAPFSLSNTVTVGVISSISRAGRELGIRDGIDYIQTDASINIGNSGGPLLNLDGEAIGVNTLKVGEGISFAIPSYYASKFLHQAEKVREANRKSGSWWGGGQDRRNDIDSRHAPVPKRKRYLGLTMITLTPSLIESYQDRDRDFPNVRSGVLIWRVVLGSPAHLVGLRAGDIIQSINGRPIIRADDVYQAMEADSMLEITIRRKNEEIVLRVKPEIVE